MLKRVPNGLLKTLATRTARVARATGTSLRAVPRKALADTSMGVGIASTSVGVGILLGVGAGLVALGLLSIGLSLLLGWEYS